MTRAAALLLLAGLAAACGDSGITPQTLAVAADSADQIAEGMTTNIVKDGVRQSSVASDTAFIYQSRQVADLRNVTAHFFSSTGAPVSILTSRTGWYEIERGTLEARGNVVVVSVDGSGRRLETEHLVYDPNMNQIRSDSAFTYTSPTGVLRGNSFYSDPEFRNVVTRQPRGRQRGQGVLLPGQ
jgi:LPS export ABC transporter protein LptC